MITSGTPRVSAASLAEVNVRICWLVGTKTFPPMCPHFFSAASWSSKWTAATPASINFLVSSNTFNAPPNPASPSAIIGII